MPLLGDIFLNTVYSEKVNGGIKTTDHAIEDGVDITDHIERNAKTLDISGVVTGPDAATRRTRLEEYMNSGKMLKYSYRNILTDVLITDFDSTHDVEVDGGFKYKIMLKKIKIANATLIKKKLPPKQQPIVAGTTNKGLQQTSGTAARKTYVVKAGDSLSKIAGMYKTSVTKLHEKNRAIIGADVNKIYPGQKLIIPA